MDKKTSTEWIRNAIVFVNTVILVLCTLTAGITAHLIWKNSKSEIEKLVREGYILLIVASTTIVILFLGYCGAIWEQKLMLLFFSISMFIILTVMIVFVYMESIDPAKIDDITRKNMKEYIKNYGNNSYQTKYVDDFQKEFKCCGVTDDNITISWHSWAELNPQEFGHDEAVPDSCCRKKEKLAECRENTTDYNAYLYDCVVKTEKYFNKTSKFFKRIEASISLTLILGIMLSSCGFLQIRKNLIKRVPRRIVKYDYGEDDYDEDDYDEDDYDEDDYDEDDYDGGDYDGGDYDEDDYDEDDYDEDYDNKYSVK